MHAFWSSLGKVGYIFEVIFCLKCMEFEGLLNFIIENKQVFHFSIAVF